MSQLDDLIAGIPVHLSNSSLPVPVDEAWICNNPNGIDICISTKRYGISVITIPTSLLKKAILAVELNQK